MSNESIRITGVAETQRKLYAFSDKLGDRIPVLYGGPLLVRSMV